MARLFCNQCGRPLIALGGYNLSDNCPYCGSNVSEQVADEIRNHDASETESESFNEIDEAIASANQDDPDEGNAETEMNKMNFIHCWYCDYPNLITERRCSNCDADLFAVTARSREGDMDKRFVSQLTPSEQNMFLIEGLKAFIAAVLRREGNDDGMVRCHNRGCHGGQYRYDEFVCPVCDGPTLLQEMRGVVSGNLNNSDIVREFQKSFPHFNIIKYTNSAVMDHRAISAAKIDLEDAARETASMLRTGAEFLRAVTSSKKKKSRSSYEEEEDDVSRGSGVGSLFDMSDVDNQPDSRVLDLLSESAIRGNSSGSNQTSIDSIPPDTPEIPDDNMGDIDGDWTA